MLLGAFLAGPCTSAAPPTLTAWLGDCGQRTLVQICSAGPRRRVTITQVPAARHGQPTCKLCHNQGASQWQRRSKAINPTSLVIWGDDIGQSNLSCYTHGLMGYKTPNIDRIAEKGMLFTDSYGEQSCTAGRSSFITGQSVLPHRACRRSGIPAAPIGMNDKLVTIAALLKEQGYATGQFGKNHLGDLNHMLPTNHGFDEFFGNLYHLNAEEEPEMDNYPEGSRDSELRRLRPRGVIHSWATDKDDKTVAAALGQGRQAEDPRTPGR